MGQIPASFVYLRLFYMARIKYKLIKALRVCLGLEPGVANGKIHRAMAVPQIINFDSKFVHRIGIFYNLRPAVPYEEKRFTVQVRVVVLDFSLD